jgi:hypothetical protein
MYEKAVHAQNASLVAAKREPEVRLLCLHPTAAASASVPNCKMMRSEEFKKAIIII